MDGLASAYLGETIAGRYRLTGHIADGHFSHVFKATDQRSGTLVAVKMLQPSAAVDAESTLEFKQERELLETLTRSRNVVCLTDSGKSTINFTINQISSFVLVSFHVTELADGALSELLLR